MSYRAHRSHYRMESRYLRAPAMAPECMTPDTRVIAEELGSHARARETGETRPHLPVRSD